MDHLTVQDISQLLMGNDLDYIVRMKLYDLLRLAELSEAGNMTVAQMNQADLLELEVRAELDL